MLEKLFTPQSVAVIGASRVPGKVGHTTVCNLLEAGFSGAIVPIHPEGGKLLGLQAYPHLADCPHDIDLAMITVPAEKVLAAVQDAIAKKVGAVVVVASGFKESGAKGAQLEKELVALCAQGGVRLLGPNCLGLINTQLQLNASFSKRMPQAGKLAVFSQSGALCTAMMDAADSRRLGVSIAVSIGNKADITEVDILSYLAHDSASKVITGYLEDIADGDQFVKAAEEASKQKPVVILKAGITAAGARAASHHTGVATGQDTAPQEPPYLTFHLSPPRRRPTVAAFCMRPFYRHWSNSAAAHADRATYADRNRGSRNQAGLLRPAPWLSSSRPRRAGHLWPWSWSAARGRVYG